MTSIDIEPTLSLTETLEQEDWDQYPDIYEELSKFIFTGKYARYLEDENRRETHKEAVDRVEAMHLRKYAHLDEKHLEEIKRAFDLVRDKRVGPSGRTLQFGGKAVEAVNLRSYNCAVRHIDSIRAFAEVFYLLLCGAGVGLGLTYKYLNRLPDLVDASDKTGTVLVYVVEDTIEGWSDSIEALLMCYFRNTPFTGRKIVFDYSKIRPEGAPLKTSGGKAPGYKGLKASHKKIKKLLDTIIEERGQSRLKSIDAYDILMHVADAVLSGGVRRSATSVMFDKDDEDMIMAKTGNWFEENPQRARSNNSVMLIRDEVTKEEFDKVYERTREWGEPGFVFVDNEDVLLNPCFEIGFIPVTEDGVCGVQVCNLTTINAAKVKSKEDFLEAVEAAALIGTLQASYTDFPYLSNTAEQLTEEEALLGVSMTAMMESADIVLDPGVQQMGTQRVLDTNDKWADILGINRAARVTAIKPEGTSTLVFGSMASGIHPAHANYMFRRVQSNKLDNVYRHFKAHNPHLCEESVWSANKTDDVATFPIRVPDDAITKDDLDAISHLEIIKSTQENWVMPGKRTNTKEHASHNVSCTVIVDDHEWDDVADYLYDNRKYFTAVSLTPRIADKKFEQAPNEAVTTHEDAEKFIDGMKNFIPVDYSWMEESEDNTTHNAEAVCAGPEGCDVKTL